MVKPIGVSILRSITKDQVSYESQFENLAYQIDYETVKGTEMMDEYDTSLFRQPDLHKQLLQGSSSCSDLELVVKVLSALKLSISGELEKLSSNISSDPGNFSYFAEEAFASQYKFESI